MKRGIVCLLALLLLFTACAKHPTVKQNKGEQDTVVFDTAADKGMSGYLTVAARKPDTFNPLTTTYESCRELFYLFYDGLFSLTADFQAEGNLAKSLVMSDDAQSGIMTLRQDVFFSNGRPFTADDVIYTVDFLRNMGGPYAGCVTNIKSIEKTDSYTLVLTLYTKEANIASMLTFPIVAKDSPANMTYPIGTGAFYALAQDVEYTSLKCHANNSYHRGEPKLRGIFIEYMNTDLKAVSSFVSGETSTFASYDLPDEIVGMPDIQIDNGATSRVEFLGFNTENGLFSDELMRRMIASALDRQALCEELAGKMYTPSDTPVHPDAWFCHASLVSGDEAATKVLERSGFTINQSGIYEKDGISLHFTILVNSDSAHAMTVANLISRFLMGNGISADIEGLTYEAYKKRLMDGDFEAFLGGASIGDMADPAFLFFSGASANVFRYSGGVMDMRLSAMAGAKGEALINECTKFRKAFLESTPAVMLYFRRMYVASRGNLVVPSLSPSGLYVTSYLWYLTK